MAEAVAATEYSALPETKRQRYELLRGQLENERASFIPHWRDLSDYILPRRSRFYTGDANKGDRRNKNIIDNTATLAARTLRSGMMGGVTSPARPWFRLTTPDPGLAEFGPVKNWLNVVTQRMQTVFLRSNLYQALPIIYGDLGTFATAALFIEEDFDDVIRCYAFPIGSYMIANNSRLKVDVFMRDFQMTVRQLVQKFGQKDPVTKKVVNWGNFSSHVQSLYKSGQLETWIDITHVIQPNPDFDPNKMHSKFKKYSSCYYERGSRGTNTGNYMATEPDVYLSEMGYDNFPVLVPRWEVTGEDAYGTSCPGMESLGDIRALQLMQKRKAQALDKVVNPPLTGPAELRNQKVSLLSGDITYSNEREGSKGLRPIHEVRPEFQAIMLDIADHQKRITRAFYEDLFLMLANTDRRQITAREIDERYEEKLLALGPVLEQMNQDLLDPLVDLVFDVMNRQGYIPEPPEEIQGAPLKVEYISIMAQAQKAIGLGSIERFATFVGQVAATTGQPSVLDKVDLDQMVDEYADASGVTPNIVRPDDAVEEIRAQRAADQKAAADAEQAKTMAGAAKNLSETDMSTDNALTRLVKDSNAGSLVN